MTAIGQVYVCEICGNIVEVIGAADGTLVCCGEPMTLMAENTSDGAKEKHVPVVTQDGHCLRVQVGSVLHPSTPQHYIEWIELVQGDTVRRKYLKPGDEPVAEFLIENESQPVVRAYCNLHGLWKS